MSWNNAFRSSTFIVFASVAISCPDATSQPAVFSDTEVLEVDAPKKEKIPATEIIPARIHSSEQSKASDTSTTPETREYGYVPKFVPFATSDGRFKVQKNPNRKTVALALGGGGVRGAAHVGVLKVLEKAGIPIDYIVGNSMGSIVGGLYASGVDMDALCTHRTFTKFRKSYLPTTKASFIKLPASFFLRPFTSSFAGIGNGKKFEKFLRSNIPKGKENIESLNIPFSAVVTNLIDGQAYRISEGDLATAMRASSSISPLLRPVKIGNKVCMDGGVRANLPASAARDTGADVVIAVGVDDKLQPISEKKIKHFRGTAERIANIVLAVTDEHQMQYADVVISPDVSGISILSKKKEDIGRAMERGEVAAEKALPLIRRKLDMSSSQLSKTGQSQ